MKQLRKFLIPLIIFIVTVNLYGCTKSNTNFNLTEWVFNGTDYKAQNTGYDTLLVTGLLSGADSAGNYIDILFNSHPTANAIFTVTRDEVGVGFPSSNCSVTVGNNYLFNTYISTGKSGETVSLTIIHGKFHASFTNITITNGSDTTTLSGTVIQNK